MSRPRPERILYSSEIPFELHNTGKVDREGQPCYRATLCHSQSKDDKSIVNIMDKPEDIRDSGLTPTAVANGARSLLKLMVKKVLDDRITVRFEDLFEVRADIRGTFHRIDEPFDPEKHKLVVNLVPLKGLTDAYRRDTLPANVRRMPKGRIDHVTYEGGEMGEVMIGKDIIIRGHDLYLDKGDTVMIRWEKPNGEPRKYIVGNLTGLDHYILKNTPDELRLKWFAGEREDIAIKPGTIPKLFVNTHIARRNQSYIGRGTASDIRIIPLMAR